MLRRHGTAFLFVLLVLLHLVPVWSVRYVPSCDGPSHVYNAWVLQALARGSAPPAVADALAVRIALFPNWLGHLLLALGIATAGPLAGEKLLLSALLAGLAGAAWFLAGSVRAEDGDGQGTGSPDPPGVERAAAFLVFPLLYSWPFQMGFHSFSAGVVIDLLLVGCFWRFRKKWTGTRLAALAGLGLLAALAHPVAIAVGGTSLAVLWVADAAGWRGQVRRVLFLLPVALAAGGFLFAHRDRIRAWTWPLSRRLTYLFTYRTLFTLSERQVALGFAAAVLVAALVAVALITKQAAAARRETTPFLVLTGILIGCFLVSPDSGFGGSILGPRLALYPGLVLIPWLAGRLPRRAGTVTALSFAAWSVWEIALLLPAYRAGDRDLRAYLTGLEAVPAGSSVWIAPESASGAPAKIGIYLHAAAYAAAEKGLLLWPNYEVDMPYFPIERRSGAVAPPDLPAVVDYGYGWRLPADSPARSRFEREFDLVATTDAGGTLYRRRAHHPRRGTHFDPTHAHQRPAT